MHTSCQRKTLILHKHECLLVTLTLLHRPLVKTYRTCDSIHVLLPTHYFIDHLQRNTRVHVRISVPYIGRYSTEFTVSYNVFTFLVSVGSFEKPVLNQSLPNSITFYSHRDRCATTSVRNSQCSSRRTIQLPECCIPPSDHSVRRNLNAKRKVQCSYTLYDVNQQNTNNIQHPTANDHRVVTAVKLETSTAHKASSMRAMKQSAHSHQDRL